MEDKVNNIIAAKLKQKTGLPEIKIALELAGHKITIHDLIFKINELEK